MMTRDEKMRDEIARRGLEVTQRGNCLRVHGPGVDLLVDTLATLSDTDLRPESQAGMNRNNLTKGKP